MQNLRKGLLTKLQRKQKLNKLKVSIHQPEPQRSSAPSKIFHFRFVVIRYDPLNEMAIRRTDWLASVDYVIISRMSLSD